MFFFKPITLAIAIAAGAQAAATPDTSNGNINARGPTGPEYHPNVQQPGGLPPCHGSSVGRRLARDNTDSLGLEIRDDNDDGSGAKKYSSNYIPPKCGQLGFNCVYAQPGVSYQSGPGPIEKYPRDDGTEVLVFKYWQPEVTFTATGGTTVIYFAHDTIWTCAKGTMRAKTIVAGGDVHGSSGSSLYDCVCTYVLSDDLVLWAN